MYYLVQTFRGNGTWGYVVFGNPEGELRVVPSSSFHGLDKRIAFERKDADGLWRTMYTNPGQVIREYEDQQEADAEYERLIAVQEVMDT